MTTRFTIPIPLAEASSDDLFPAAAAYRHGHEHGYFLGQPRSGSFPSLDPLEEDLPLKVAFLDLRRESRKFCGVLFLDHAHRGGSSESNEKSRYCFAGGERVRR